MLERALDGGDGTPRERFLLALALGSPLVNDLVPAELERIRAGGVADYLGIVPARLTRDLPAPLRGVGSGARLFQFLGSHDPFHFGHKVMAYTLVRAGLLEGSRASIATMGDNPVKGLTLDTYGARHRRVVDAVARDPVLSSAPVSAVDLPTGVGASRDTLLQSALLAALAGDLVRVVMGSDKFVLDAERLIAGDDNAAAKYTSASRRHYVVVRQEDSPADVAALHSRLPRAVGDRVVVLPKLEYGPRPISSTLIRRLRSSGVAEDADLATLLADGVPESGAELGGAADVLHPVLVDGRAEKDAPHEDPATWRYQPEHGCVGPLVARDDDRV